MLERVFNAVSTLALSAVFAVPAFGSIITVSEVLPGSANQLIVDIRPESDCLNETVDGAHCLPVADMLRPNGRPVNYSSLSWLLGTAGITGSETVVVVGGHSNNKWFVAGMLYLAGQSTIVVVNTSVPALLRSHKSGAGTKRATTRVDVFEGMMRSEQMVLQQELHGLLQGNDAPVLLDMRPEREYWGDIVRSVRGGHLPGAVNVSVSAMEHIVTTEFEEPPVVYAHDFRSSVAAFARVAMLVPDARVYTDGWVDWAANTTLPVDALAYTRSNRQ